HEKHLRLHGQRAGDAKALLLAAGESQGALLEAILHLVPDGGLGEALFHDFVAHHPGADAVGTGAIGDGVVEAHGERVGLRGYHAHASATAVAVHAAGDLLVVELYRAGDAAALHQIIDAVEAL